MNTGVNEFLHSPAFKTLLLGTGAITILLMVFTAGIYLGYQKMEFSYHWAENYPRNFVIAQNAGPGTVVSFPDAEHLLMTQNNTPAALNAYGIFGAILGIRANSLIIKGVDEAEKNVLISNATDIEEGIEQITIKDLEVGEQVVVIGRPTQQGQINAELIRVFNH